MASLQYASPLKEDNSNLYVHKIFTVVTFFCHSPLGPVHLNGKSSNLSSAILTCFERCCANMMNAFLCFYVIDFYEWHIVVPNEKYSYMWIALAFKVKKESLFAPCISNSLKYAAWFDSKIIFAVMIKRKGTSSPH